MVLQLYEFLKDEDKRNVLVICDNWFYRFYTRIRVIYCNIFKMNEALLNFCLIIAYVCWNLAAFFFFLKNNFVIIKFLEICEISLSSNTL